MSLQLAIIGFGEAGQAFAQGANWDATAHDIAADGLDGATLRRSAERAGVRLCRTLGEALAGRSLVLSLVTADAALAVAEACAPWLAAGACYMDMNSVAPATKRAAAAVIEAAGGRYADVAIMAPVLPARRTTPLLVAGPATAAAHLATLGFSNVHYSGATIGVAAAIKLCRSIIVKGIEALTAEALEAADRAGVVDAVVEALGPGWQAQADYHLDRMMVHGERRAAEMAEAACMLNDLGVAPLLTRGTIARQASIGVIGAAGPLPEGLEAKLARLRTGQA